MTMLLVREKSGWSLNDRGNPVWIWPDPVHPDRATVPAWVVDEILEAFDEQQQIMDGMYDALGPGADDVMEIVIDQIRFDRGG